MARKQLGIKSLDEYPLEYEEPRPLARPKTTPSIINHHPKSDGEKEKRVRMPNVPKIKPYATSRIEVAKTVLIAVLLTSVIAFVAGMQFKANQQSEVQNAVHAAVQAEAPAKK